MRPRLRVPSAVAALVCALGAAAAARQAPTAPAAEQVFKDVQVLKGIPADEFMDTMGMFSSSLLFDCTGCHDSEILIRREAFSRPTPRIQKARQMVLMVNALNRTYFGGERRVTCFTCHRGSSTPDVEPDLALQYSEGASTNPNAMRIYPDPRGSAERIFARLDQALGGAERLSAVTSIVATGRYTGFNTSDVAVPIEIVARAPNQLATIVRMPDGDAVRVFDGRSAWAAEGWRQLPLMTFTGSNLAGARLEAITWFPAGLQRAFAQWQVSSTVIDGRDVQVLQGTNPGELPVNLYVDEGGLLVRTVRWNSTPVGRVPTQTDFSDYREVGGVRIPFRTVVTWTNGRNTIELAEVRVNAPIPASRFAQPAPFRPR